MRVHGYAKQATLGWSVDGRRPNPSTVPLERIFPTSFRTTKHGRCVDVAMSGKILEAIAFQFDNVLKVDPHTLNRSRAKYAHICVELDLSQPLQQGTWVQYSEKSC